MGSALLLHLLIASHTLIGAISTACLFYLYYAAWRGRHPANAERIAFAGKGTA